MPSPRASAVAFSVGEKGFVFGGRNANGTLCNDMWQYDPVSDTWHNQDASPLLPRVHAMAQVAGDAVYIGLGFRGRVYTDSCYLRDFWHYTPATGEWKRLADFPNANTIRPVTYLVGQQIYVLYGGGTGFSRDITVYDIPTDTWTTLSDNHLRALAGYGCMGATCQGRCFLGGGFNTGNLDQWYEAHLDSDQWDKLRAVPHGGRTLAACAANSCAVYVLGGRHWGGTLTTGHLFADILSFSPETERWTDCGTMPYGETENLVAFAIGERIYFGLGEDIDGNIHNQFYRIDQ